MRRYLAVRVARAETRAYRRCDGGEEALHRGEERCRGEERNDAEEEACGIEERSEEGCGGEECGERGVDSLSSSSEAQQQACEELRSTRAVAVAFTRALNYRSWQDRHEELSPTTVRI